MNSSAKDSQILEDSVKQINDWFSYYGQNNDRAYQSRYFTYISQWDGGTASTRQIAGKKTLTFNVLKPITRAILGQQRKSTPQLGVNLIEAGASQQDANLIASILRQIQVSSDAATIFQMAFRDAVDCGYGAFRIGLEYEKEKSFDVSPRFFSIPDCTLSYFDPCATLPTKSDGLYAGYYYIISEEQFKRDYPDIDYVGAVAETRDSFSWVQQDCVIVCNHYVKEYYKDSWIELDNGLKVGKSEWDAIRKEIREEAKYLNIEPIYPEVIRRKNYTSYRIMNYKLIANTVLEKSEWPCQELPVIFVSGDKVNLSGREITLPFLEDAQDAQRLINYANSEIATSISRARTEKFMATASNIKGYENIWRNPASYQGALIYNPDPKTGAPPQIINPPPFNQQLLSIVGEQQQQIKESLGRFNESSGAQSNAISGTAVLARQAASDNSIEIFYDNLDRAVEQAGKVLLGLIPKIYAEEREMVVREKDGSAKNITINKRGAPRENENGEIEYIIENEIKDLEYGIELVSEPNFEYQKARSFAQYSEFVNMSGNPAQTFPLIADLVAADLNTREAKDVAVRMRDNVVPPQVVAQEENKPLPPPQPSPAEKQQMFENQVEVEKLKIQKADILGKLIDQLINLEKTQDEATLDLIKTKNENEREATKLALEAHEHLQNKIVELAKIESNNLS